MIEAQWISSSYMRSGKLATLQEWSDRRRTKTG